MKRFTFFTIILLFAAAFVCDSPQNIFQGVQLIILSRSALITDYFALAGMGAAFFNAALVLTVCTALVIWQKIPFTGPTMAALFMNAGYGLWGKNPLNILPILLGVWFYARLHNAHIGRFIYTALFGTCLAPFVTEMAYILPFSTSVNILCGVMLGFCIGFLLPPLSTHTASMHMGYSLFNVGFSAGILAFVMVCILRSLGLESGTVLIWQEGRPAGLIVGLYLYFIAAFLTGLIINKGKIRGLIHITRHPGRAVADFVLMDGCGATLMNMALMGMLAVSYILLVGGDLSGPVVGAVCVVFGFSAFGAHIKNYLPVLVGVSLYTVLSNYQTDTPGILLAALFGVGLAPIAGQFGIVAGILAGVLHSCVVMCTANMYGGLNLYNNGFSAGWVAIFMVPMLESFIRHFESRERSRVKNRDKGKNKDKDRDKGKNKDKDRNKDKA
ncbi:MAG: DUF1576 domain-containing protein [Roseburia sp.]|nr:DUF1576 domain-containing protein [Roseburia sp.]